MLNGGTETVYWDFKTCCFLLANKWKNGRSLVLAVVIACVWNTSYITELVN
jgi:hypothetical protein